MPCELTRGEGASALGVRVDTLCRWDHAGERHEQAESSSLQESRTLFQLA
jgi:hypothetical protein